MSERVAGKVWPAIIVGFLALSVGSNVLLLVRASADPGFAVEKNYYQRAVAWDSAVEARARSEALGWSIEIGTKGVVEGSRKIAVLLEDREGAPVTGAEVSLETFHLAHGNEILEANLSEVAPGGYEAELPLVRPGLWEMRFVARRGDQVFVPVIRREIGP
jgi:nitrogen fixation protein FixH